MSTDSEGLKNTFDTSWENLKGEDSRLKQTRVTHPIYPLERTYCVVCGKAKGWVSMDSYKHIRASNIIVVCDDCEASYGKPPLVEAKIQEVV